MSSNVDILSKMLVPRKYQDTSLTLRHDLAVLLRDHPEAFDCLIFPARPSEENERVTVDPPVAGLLDRDERGISYGEPVQARAYIVPQEDLAFQVVDSALYESIVGTLPAVHILLSVPGVRTFSLIQWLEYLTPDACDPVERTYYVKETRPLGRTLNADVLHVCYPLPALGEVPILGEESGEEDTGKNTDTLGEETGDLATGNGITIGEL